MSEYIEVKVTAVQKPEFDMRTMGGATRGPEVYRRSGVDFAATVQELRDLGFELVGDTDATRGGFGESRG